MKYFVFHKNKSVGPWTQEQILQKLKDKELLWTDYFYSEEESDWKTFLADPPFAALHNEYASSLSTEKSSVIPFDSHGKSSNEKMKEKEWFVLRGENKYGPFAFLDLVRMLQEKQLMDWDYVWNKSMQTWSKVSDHTDFQPQKIRELKLSKNPEVEEAFFRRRHARIKYGTSLLVHNNKEVWKAQSLEVSAGGAGIVLSHDHLSIGESIHLHFKPGDGVPAFNALCTVVSRSHLNGHEHKYGVKFSKVAHTVQMTLKEFAEKQAS